MTLKKELCQKCGGNLELSPIQIDVMMIPPTIQMRCVDCKTQVFVEEKEE